MAETHVSIGQVKRDISDLVNRVAYRKERIVLTSRGKPKAVLVSVEDYERLKAKGGEQADDRWEEWLADCRTLGRQIMERRNGEWPDLDALWAAARADLEERDAHTLGD